MKKNANINWNRVELSSLDLSGWNVAVIGGTGGLGRAISRSLASRGATVRSTEPTTEPTTCTRSSRRRAASCRPTTS